MKRRALIVIAVLALCAFISAMLFLDAWGWSLTTEKMTVFVSNVEEVDGAKCIWSGSQHFEVVTPEARAQFRVMAFKSEQEMSAWIAVSGAEEVKADSIQLRLVYKHADGNLEEIPMTPLRTPLTEQSENGGVRSWWRYFRISGDLKILPTGSVRLQWSMDYKDSNGELKNMSITVPLRREEITIPSSIVRRGPQTEILRSLEPLWCMSKVAPGSAIGLIILSERLVAMTDNMPGRLILQ